VTELTTINQLDMWVPTFVVLPLLTCLQSDNANTWFKNLYERSDLIDVTATAKRSALLYDKQAFNLSHSFNLQRAFKSFHILITDNTYVTPKFEKAALVNILKSESKPFLFIGIFYLFSVLDTW